MGLKDATSLEFIKTGDLSERKKEITEDYYILESESGHSEKYVAPYITPFEIINNLCKFSVNDAGSLYFFFEDTNNFRFVNIEENSRGRKNSKNVQKFICFPSDTVQEGIGDKRRRWNSVIDYSIRKRFDGDVGVMKLNDLINVMVDEIKNRRLTHSKDAAATE